MVLLDEINTLGHDVSMITDRCCQLSKKVKQIDHKDEPKARSAFFQKQCVLRDVTRILVVEEKHGNYYYLIPTLERYHLVALKIIAQRQAAGYLYLDDDDPRSQKEIAQRIIDQQDGPGAVKFLFGRSENQYEQLTIEYFETDL